MKKLLFALFFVLLFSFSCVEPKDEEKINYSETNISLEVGDVYTFQISQNVGYLCEEDEILLLDNASATIKALKAGDAKVTIYLIDKDTVKLEVTITVTAATPIVTYTISYDLDGGVATDLVETFSKDEIVTLGTPTKDGYAFLGWYQGDTKVTTITNKNYTLVAKWRIVGPSIIIKKEVEKCYVGNEFELSLEGINSKQYKDYKWIVSDESLLEIDRDYYAICKKSGEVTIVVSKIDDETIYGIITIYIYPQIPSIYLNSNIILIGNTFTIGLRNYPNADDFLVQISDDTIVSHNNGTFLALQCGEVVIKYVHIEDESIFSELRFTVYQVAPVLKLANDAIAINETIRLDVLNYSDVSAYVIKPIEDGIISVNGRIITGIKPGNVRIQVTLTNNPEIYSYIDLLVKPTAPKIMIGIEYLLMGGKTRLMVTNLSELESSNIADYAITITSSLIASIDSDCMITGLSEGVATVTITLKNNPLVTSTAQITVSKTSAIKDANGEIGQGSLFVYMNDAKSFIKAGEMSYIFIDQALDLEMYKWVTSNDNILQVYENGRVVAIASGYASIYVSSKTNSEVKARINIEVYGEPNVDYISRFISIAETQLGIKEAANGQTKYGVWYGLPNEAWCAMFVSWCAFQSGIYSDVIPKYCGCLAGMEWFVSRGQFGYKGVYTPKAGDLIFFLSDGASHTGIVTSCSNGTVYTIEGNTSNMVARRSYLLTHSQITGYGIPNYPPYDSLLNES